MRSLKSHMVYLLINFSPVNLTKSRPLRQDQYGIILACLLTKQELCYYPHSNIGLKKKKTWVTLETKSIKYIKL